MLTVGIKNFELWTFVGLYPEEKVIPNKLIFNIQVTLPHIVNDSFLDYTLLIDIIKDTCRGHVELLETLLTEIAQKIKKIVPEATQKIQIEKCNPPTGDQIQSSFVKWVD